MEASSKAEVVAQLVDSLMRKNHNIRLGQALAQQYGTLDEPEPTNLEIRIQGARAWAEFLVTCSEAVEECERCSPRFRERVLPPYQNLLAHSANFSSDHTIGQAASGFDSNSLWLASHSVTLELGTKRLDTSELAQITAKLDELLTSVEASSIETSLKSLIIAELTRIRVAISLYHIRGDSGLQTAANEATGLLVRALINDKSGNSVHANLILGAIDFVSSVVTQAQAVSLHIGALPGLAEGLRLLQSSS